MTPPPPPPIFEFDTRPIRVQMDEQGDPWFNANDVCAALGYANPRDAVAAHVDDDDVAKRDTIDNLGRTQQANHLNESGVYALIFGSTLPEAKRFKKWVTAEVLPAIRKTGGYQTPRRDPVCPPFTRFELGRRLAELKAKHPPRTYRALLESIGFTPRRANRHILFYQHGQRYPGLREMGESHFGLVTDFFRLAPPDRLAAMEARTPIGQLAAATLLPSAFLVTFIDQRQAEAAQEALNPST